MLACAATLSSGLCSAHSRLLRDAGRHVGAN
jgi:hypothetical protein